MPHYTETRILPYPPEQLFTLVADVEHYPQFLPWCRAVRILERASDYFIAEMIVSFSHITERYTSKVMPIIPAAAGAGQKMLSAADQATNDSADSAPLPTSPLRGEENIYRIDVTLVSGPFTHLTNHWEFHPHPQGAELQFTVDFEFKSKILNGLIGGLFTRASEKMVSAFTKRAEALYGGVK